MEKENNINLISRNIKKLLILENDLSIENINIEIFDNENFYANKINIKSNLFSFDLIVMITMNRLIDKENNIINIFINESNNDGTSSVNVYNKDLIYEEDNIYNSIYYIVSFIKNKYLKKENRINEIDIDTLRSISLLSYFLPMNYNGLVDDIILAIKYNIEFDNPYISEVIIEHIKQFDSSLLESIRHNQHTLFNMSNTDFMFLAPFKDQIIVHMDNGITKEMEKEEVRKRISIKGALLPDPEKLKENPLGSLLNELDDVSDEEIIQ